MLVRNPFTGNLVRVNPGLVAEQLRHLAPGALPDADIAGAIGVGVVPGGEKPSPIRQAQLEAAPPPFHTYRPLAGLQQNNRGAAVSVLLDTLNSQPAVRVPSIIETPRSNGDDAETIGVQLQLSLPPEYNDPTSGYDNVPVDVVCLIEWGIGGASFNAQVDWGRGVAFSVDASFLRISAQVGAIPNSIPLPILPPMFLAAAIGYGNPSSTNLSTPLRFTQKVSTAPGGVFGPGASATFVIPDWALGFTLVDGGNAGNSFAPPNYQISIAEGNGFSTSYTVTDRSNMSYQVEGQFPIPKGGRFITVINNAAVPSISPKLIYNLAF